MTFGFIVDQSGNGNFTTLTSAMSAAYSGVTITMRPGIYIEDVTFKDGVNVSASTGDSESGNTKIIGKCTITSGVVTISNIFLTNTDYAIEVSGSNTVGLNLDSCFLSASGTNAFINFTNSNSSSSVNIYYSQGNITGSGAYWNSTSPGHIGIQSSFLYNSSHSTSANTSINTHIDIISSGFSSRLVLNGAGSLAIGNSDMDCSTLNSATIFLNGSSSATLTNCYIASGNGQAILINTGCFACAMGVNIISTGTYAINGNGTLLYNNLSFPGTSTVAVTNLTRMGYLG
jgi:hypothetical protein